MSLKIKMTCPRCGNSTWIRRDDGFECAACEEFCYPEDMGSQAEENEVDVIRKALADWRPELNHIIETLGTEELLAQLAEEAAELGKAALKLRRALDGKNPTPVSPSEALRNVREEMADVLLCSISEGQTLRTIYLLCRLADCGTSAPCAFRTLLGVYLLGARLTILCRR